MSVNGSNSSKLGHQDDICNLNHVNEVAQVDGVGAICLPQIMGNIVFHLTSESLLFLLGLRNFMLSIVRWHRKGKRRTTRSNLWTM